MTVKIHSTAIVSEKAEIGNNVDIGPFCIIGDNVKISDNCSFKSHVVVEGHTSIAENNKFYQFCSIGADPQDSTYKGESTRVEIGDNNTFREYISIHKGTMKDNQLTKIGDNNLFMAYVHVGHDVQFGSNCVIANACGFAGHAKIADKVILGGGCLISQFLSLGQGAYLGGGSVIANDVPPFCTGFGNRVKIKGVNIVGLRRQGHSKETISEFVDFFRQIESSTYSPKAFIKHFDEIDSYYKNGLVKSFVDFIRQSEMGIAPYWS